MALASVLQLPSSPLRLAVHTFESLETAPFDTSEYSKLKFGSDRVARNFGYEMADAFYHQNLDILLSQPVVVTPAPSTTVPVAATLLSRHFMNRLNSRLSLIDNAMPVEWTLIHRNMTYNNNYADLPKEERKKLLAADTIYLNKDFVEGKFIIFIDDCTITGTHEEKISNFLDEEGMPNEHAFVCYAQYRGSDPSIEMRLNHVEVKTARCLAKLSWEKGHTVTTRSLRLLLEHPENDFDALLDSSNIDFIEDSFHAAIVKGYNRHEPYETNFKALAARVAAVGSGHKGLGIISF